MWGNKISFARLVEDGRWKVEFFSGAADLVIRSGYPLVQLSELVRESRDTVDPQATPDQIFNYLSLENVESLTGDLINFSPRYGREIRSRSKIFYRGAVLYSRLRPYLNKVYLADGVVSEGICSGEFYVLGVDKERVVPRYLRAVLSSHYVLKNITRFQSGAALPRIPIKDLLNMKIPLPPLEEQLKLEKFLKESEQERQKLRKDFEMAPQKMMTHLFEYLQKGQADNL